MFAGDSLGVCNLAERIKFKLGNKQEFNWRNAYIVLANFWDGNFEKISDLLYLIENKSFRTSDNKRTSKKKRSSYSTLLFLPR